MPQADNNAPENTEEKAEFYGFVRKEARPGEVALFDGYGRFSRTLHHPYIEREWDKVTEEEIARSVMHNLDLDNIGTSQDLLSYEVWQKRENEGSIGNQYIGTPNVVYPEGTDRRNRREYILKRIREIKEEQ